MNCWSNFYWRLSFTIVVSLCLCSCSSDPSENVDNGPGNEPQDVETIIPDGTEAYLNEDSDYIFDQDQMHTFELNLPPEALARLDSDPAAEEYVEGSLTFRGETLSPVGIRYKGSIGAYVGCVSGSDWTNPSGHKTCTKLSMKVKVNWLDSDDKFYGLKKLQFHSQNLDKSQMRDRLGYWLFKEMGVPAPRCVHAKLMVNGQFVGVFAMVEQVDGRFTRYHFENGKGNLYKEVWPLNSRGQVPSEHSFIRALETNEEDNPSADIIRAFGQAVASSDDETVGAVVSEYMNVEDIMAYVVVDRTIRVDDGPFHWYCGGSDCSNHNYYWYEDPVALKLHLIPWDLDNAFENIVSNINPVTPIADNWGEVTANCQPFEFGSFRIRQRSAACDKLTNAWVGFQEEYELQKSRFIEGPFAEGVVDQLLDKWTDQIRSATTEASQRHNDAVRPAQWESAVNDLKFSLTVARNK